MKKSIAIDMDNVIADVSLHYLDLYEKETGIRIPETALQGVPELEVFPDKTAVIRYLHTPGFFRTVPLMSGAQEALKELQKHFELYIVSAAMEFPQSLSEKKEWLAAHFPFISWRNIIFCGDKSIIGTDLMVDDHLKNLDHFKGKAFLFSAGHNIHVTKYPRLNNWSEAVEILGREK